MQSVGRPFPFLPHSEERLPQVDESDAELAAQKLDTLVGQPVAVVFPLLMARKDALDIEPGRGGLAPHALRHAPYVADDRVDRDSAAYVVGADHKEQLGGMSVYDRAEILQQLSRRSAGRTAVENTAVAAERLPPFMHIGDGVAVKHYIGRIHGERPHDVETMAAERMVGHAYRTDRR